MLWVQPHTGTDTEDEGIDARSDRIEEAREHGFEDTDVGGEGYDVDITDTEASEGLLYEEVAKLVCNIFSIKFHISFSKVISLIQEVNYVTYDCFF